MSNEVQFVVATTPTNAYFVLRNNVGQYWYPVTPAFETYNVSHWTNYAISLTRDGTSQQYNGNFPAVPAGVYNLIGFTRVGGAPAVTDTLIEHQRHIQWSGSGIAATAIPRLETTVSVTSTAGTTAHVKVQLLDYLRQLINVFTVDSAATCTVTVIQDGGATLFTLGTLDFGAPSATTGWFEADYANPGFTADRGYTAEITVVAAGVTYTGLFNFFVVP